VPHRLRRREQGRRRRFDDARGDEERRRDDGARRAPALDRAGGGVPRVDLDRVAPLADAQGDTA